MSTVTGTSAPLDINRRGDLTLFLTNLHLLDLDEYPDWPGVNWHTFRGKDARHDQRRRVQCVEWTLYHLFRKWDELCGSNDTANKLQPFFPPLEPLQSLNLRAALFRCLSKLKHDGVIGRDLPLRKTMLNDCHGPRVEEVLFLFSTAVVTKTLAQQLPSHAIARQLGARSSQPLPPRAQTLLEPLILAHRASLASRMQQKEGLRERYRGFLNVLHAKRDEITRRHEQIHNHQRLDQPDAISSATDVENLTRCLEHYWLGETTWASVLVSGNVARGGDALLCVPFAKIWSQVEHGTLGEHGEIHDDNLLADLDWRVRRQKGRVEEWKSYRRELQESTRRLGKGVSGRRNDAEASAQDVKLSFRAHQNLFLPPNGGSTRGGAQDNKRPLSPAAPSIGEYDRIMRSLEAELSVVGKARSQGGRGWRKAARPAAVEYLDPLRPASTTPLDQHDVSPGSAGHATGSMNAQALANRQATPPVEDEVVDPQAPPVTVDNDIETQGIDGARAIDTHVAHDANAVEQVPASPGTPRIRHTRLSYLNAQDQELLADEIVSSIANADPTPARLNLTRPTHVPPDPEEAAADYGDSPGDRLALPRHASLVERTRQSMSTFGGARARPTQSSQPGRAATAATRDVTPRNSDAPSSGAGGTNAPSPGTSFPPSPGESKASTPREKLFGEDADYASVFRSRPKIQLSPTVTPQHASFLTDPNDSVWNVGDSDEVDESPLRRLGQR